METINAYIQDFAYIISDLLSSIFLYGLGGGIMGFIIGCMIIRRAKKRGTFHRSNALWSFVAKCNYLVLPLAFLTMGVTQGGIYGAHNTAEGWIEQTTTPIIDYAENYLPQMQSFCNTHILDKSNASLEDAVIASNPSAASGMKGSIMTSFNVLLLGSFLDVVSPTGGEIAEPLVLLSQINLAKLDRNTFEILPASMRAATSFYFAGFYWAFFVPFGMYFLIMVSEIILFKLLTKTTQSSSTSDDYYVSDDLNYV